MATSYDPIAAKEHASAQSKSGRIGFDSPLVFPEKNTQNHWIMFRPYRPSSYKAPKATSTTSQPDQNAEAKINFTAGQAIYLYHPDQMLSNTAINWEETETGLIGALINLVTDTSMNKLKDVATRVASQTALGGKTAQIISKRQGQIINPNTELFFKGVGFREFTFNFLLAPESEEELRAVMAIIRSFKYHSVPRSQSDGWIQYPHYWEIEHKSRGKIIHNFKKCACTQVNVDSTPNQIWSTFEGGDPIAIKLELTFKELERITSQDYDNIDSEGWF